MKSLAKRAAKAAKRLAKPGVKTLLRYTPEVPLASTPYLPWPVKKKLAQFEMAARSLDTARVRASFLPHARYIKPYRMPESRRVGPIWQYWNSGAAGRPPIIQECMDSVRRYASDREIIVLNDDTLSDYVTLPPHVLAKREQIGATHFSELLRVSLLAQHGGTWIDATVLLTGRIDEFTSTIPYFMFTRPNDPYMVSSWFIHSVASHPLVCAMRDILTAYWVTEDRVREYFMFHILFESAITLHADLRGIWKTVPTVFYHSPVLLQNALLAGSDVEHLRDICCRTPLHKLSFKFPGPVQVEAERIAKWANTSRTVAETQ